MKKICFVIDVMSAGGGAQKVLKILLENLQIQGFEVCLVVLKRVQREIRVDGIETFYLLECDQKLLPNSFQILHHLTNIAKAYDLLCSFMDFITAYYVGLASALLSKPYYCFVRCEPSFVVGNFEYNEINWQLYWLTLAHAKKVICNSKASCLDVEKHFRVPADKIKLLYNPIDYEKIQTLSQSPLPASYQKGEKILCLAVGRLHEQKNYLTMLRAFKSAPSYELWVLGEGEQRESLESFLAQEQINNVKLLGYQENIYAFLHLADIFLHASTYEGFPNALLEAACLGKALLLSDIAVHREIFASEACFFAPLSHRELIWQLEYLLDQSQRAKHALLAQARIKLYLQNDFPKQAAEIFGGFGKPS